ncbi:MAG: MFS transporter [Dermatophilaceae bacterium]
MTTARTTGPTITFHRDDVTWLAYVMLAWFAYLQAAPGLVIGYLRDELGLSYVAGGLHVAAFAGGAMLAGALAARVERVVGRRRSFWSAAALMGTGTGALTVGPSAPVTIGSVLVMGVGGGLLLVTIQAALSDRHGENRAVALGEANVAAALAYVVLVGALAIAAALRVDWRAALLVSLAVPVVAVRKCRRLALDGAPQPARGAARPTRGAPGDLPAVFWVAAAMLFCTTAAEWCLTAWGATFVEDAAEVPTGTAVTIMGGYFTGVVVGRVAGSRLARRHDPEHLLAAALAVTAAGFTVLWSATGPVQALVGLAVTGTGLGNLFPMGMSVTLALTPQHPALASGRAVAVASSAVLLAPLTVGSLADTTSLHFALGAVPLMLALAAAALVFLLRRRRRTGGEDVVTPAATTAPSDD